MIASRVPIRPLWWEICPKWCNIRYMSHYKQHVHFYCEAVAQLESSRYKAVIFVVYVIYASPCI